MSALAGTMTVVNLGAFLHGIQEAQRLQLRYMRTEMKRGAQRIRKSFIRSQLQGGSGIKGGKLTKGKNIFTYVKGDEPKELYAKIGISRVLNVHEQGLTITPKRGKYLYLRENKGTAREEVVAAVPKVVIPARLKFRQQVANEAPAMLRKVADAGLRATQESMTKALKGAVGI